MREVREVRDDEDETIRKTNAYPGARNIIGSIHQRRWFLSMDRVASGFQRVTDGEEERRWVRRRNDEDGLDQDDVRDIRVEDQGAFIVRGRDVERSILTGRNADEVMRDEGVQGFVGRKGWRAVVE